MLLLTIVTLASAQLINQRPPGSGLFGGLFGNNNAQTGKLLWTYLKTCRFDSHCSVVGATGTNTNGGPLSNFFSSLMTRPTAQQ